MMAGLGINTVRTYTPPRRDLLDEAARQGLRVMVGLPWSQHVAFLDDRRLARSIRQEIVRQVAELADHPAALIFALGNEIPPGVVRWHGRVEDREFPPRPVSRRKGGRARQAAAPTSTFRRPSFSISPSSTSAPSTSICTASPSCASYLARLQHIAGHKPLLLAEAGADSVREGESGQADITAMHIRAAFEEGACGAVAFTWTDDWWRGGHPVDDWAFGLVDRDRNPKPASIAVAAAFDDAPFPREVRQAWPRVSVVVCAYNAADTLEDCLSSLERLTYPDYEIILVNDGSKDRTGEIARSHPRVRVIDTPNRGLSAARNSRSGGGDRRDRRVHRRGRTRRSRLADVSRPALPDLRRRRLRRTQRRPRRRSADGAVHRARPGEPTHVLLDDRIAEHVPGCNMAFRREALLAIGGFNPIYLRAGDDVDVCWRLQARGWKIGFSGAALVWHHHRSSVQGVLAAADRLRRGRDVADGPSSGEVPRRAHAVARAHLQPAAVRPVAVGHEDQRGCLGDRGLSVRLPHGRASVRVPAALDPLAGRVVRAGDGRPRRRHAGRPRLDGRAPARHRAHRHRVHHRQEPHLRHPIAGGLAARAASCGTGRRWRISISFSRIARLFGRIRGVLSPPEIAAAARGRAEEPWPEAVAAARPGARFCCCPEP